MTTTDPGALLGELEAQRPRVEAVGQRLQQLSVAQVADAYGKALVEAHEVKVPMARITVSLDVLPELLEAARTDFTTRWEIIEKIRLAAMQALLEGAL